jgi:hypothetical protein
MTGIEYPPLGAAVCGETAPPVKAAEITIRGRMVHGAEERVLAVLDSLDLHVFGSRSCRFGDAEMVLAVVSDGSLAREALEAAGLECQKIASVLVLPAAEGDRKTALPACLSRAGIGILYCYSLWPDNGEDCLVFKTADDDLACRVIKGGATAQAA